MSSRPVERKKKPSDDNSHFLQASLITYILNMLLFALFVFQLENQPCSNHENINIIHPYSTDRRQDVISLSNNP